MRAFSIGVAGVLLATIANAATVTVTNTNDSGPGSLRQAVIDANAGDTINFATSAYGTITLTSGKIFIQKALTIAGPGSANLTIDGNGTDRIFNTYHTGYACPEIYPATNILISISGLTLQNGRATGNRNGGAIVAGTDLALDSMVIRNNVARGGGGIGWFTQFANQALTINNTQFINNVGTPTDLTAPNPGPDNGGGLLLNENCGNTSTVATATITNSVFDGNSTQPVNDGGYGGAIAMFLPSGSVTIQDTRIVNNQAQYPTTAVNGSNGGGFYGYAANLRVERTEVAQNSAKYHGAFSVFNPPSNPNAVNFTLINSTVSGNQASNSTSGAGTVRSNVNALIANSTIANNLAGGLAISAFPNEAVPTFDSESSLFAGNAYADIITGGPAMPNPYTNCAARNSLAQTFAGVTQNCPVSAANIWGVDPLLSPLAFNGGPTRTHALAPNSVAIDKGSNPQALTTDQRGVGYPRVVGPAADIGAYEAPLPALPPSAVPTLAPTHLLALALALVGTLAWLTRRPRRRRP